MKTPAAKSGEGTGVEAMSVHILPLNQQFVMHDRAATLNHRSTKLTYITAR